MASLAAARADIPVELRWDPPNDTNAVGYILYFSDSTQTSSIDAATNAQITITLPLPAVTYRFAVRAYNLFRYEGEPSDPTLWTTPTEVTALNGNGYVGLTWLAASEALGYVVKRAAHSGGPYLSVKTNLTIHWVDEQVTNSHTYYYAVSILTPQGESKRSLETAATPALGPRALQAQSKADGVGLSWTGLGGPVTYRVKRAEVSGGPYSIIADDLVDLVFLDTTAASGHAYYYVVSARDPAGQESGHSSQASVILAPGRPAPFEASLLAARVIQLSWTLNEPVVDEFLIEWATNGGDFSSRQSVPGSQRRSLVTGLIGPADYTFRVRARNVAGESLPSDLAHASTPQFGLNVRFRPPLATGEVSEVAGYLSDYGDRFDTQTNSIRYGWNTNTGFTAVSRHSPLSPDERYDAFIPFAARPAGSLARIWEAEVPNGFYSIRLVAGDPWETEVAAQFEVEGGLTRLYRGEPARWLQFTNTILVEDRRVTLQSGPLASENKLCFVDIYSTVPIPPQLGSAPASLTLTQNSALTVSASITAGSEPLLLQWYHDGIPISGADSETWNVPQAQRRDGGKYFLVVSNLVGSVTSEVARITIVPTDFPPSLSNPDAATIAEDSRAVVSLRIDDPDSPASTVGLTVHSLNERLVPDTSLTIVGNDALRTLILDPRADEWGEAVVKIVATDLDGHSVTNTFTLMVTAVNDPPGLDPIASFTIRANSGPQLRLLPGVTAGASNETEAVRLTANVNPPQFLAALAVDYDPAMGTLLRFAPARDVEGSAIVTVIADDGQAENNLTRRSFTLNVHTNEDPSVLIEAESGDLTAPMAWGTHPKALQGGYIFTQLGNRGAGTFRVELASDGDWLVWCRILSAAASLDSFFVSVDDGPESIYDTLLEATPGNSWQWTRLNARPVPGPSVLTLSAGTHTLSFRGREAYTLLDALLLTTNRSFVPTLGLSNSPPTLDPIGAVAVSEDADPQTVVLTGLSPGFQDEDQRLTLTAWSSNPSLIPDPPVYYSPPDTTALLSFQPVPGMHGTAIIKVVVTDDGATNNRISQQFAVTVISVHDLLRVILPDHLTLTQGHNAVVPFSVTQDAGASGRLDVTAYSSNPLLLPARGLQVQHENGSDYVLVLMPQPDQVGTALIHVQALDQTGTRSAADLALTVLSPDQGPTLSALPDVNLNEDGQLTLPLTITDSERPNGPWALAAGSDNSALFAPSGLQLGGESRTRTITLTPKPDQVGVAQVTVTLANGKGAASSRSFRVTVNAVDKPPTISSVPDFTIDEDGRIGPIPIVVGDRETPDQQLEIVAFSSNTNLITDTGLAFSGQGRVRTLSIIPNRDQSGAATITVRVADQRPQTSSITFRVTVRAVNDPPTLEPLPNLVLDQDAGDVLVPLSSITAGGGESQTLSVSAVSSNPQLIPNPSVTYLSPNSTGSLRLRPAAGATGSALVQVTVDDGQPQSNRVTRSFSVLVRPAKIPVSFLPIPDQQTVEDTPLSLLVRIVSFQDAGIAPILTVSSDNPSLIPNTNLVWNGAGQARTLTLIPASNQVGRAQITLTVRDGVDTSSTSFRFDVRPDNDRPQLNPVPDFQTNSAAGNSSYVIPLSGISPGASNETQTLTITATSTNLSLLPNPTVNYTSPSATGSLTLRPASNRTGSSLVTVKVSDNGVPPQEVTRTFLVLIQATGNTLPVASAIPDQTINEDGATGPIAFTIRDAESPVTELIVRAFSSNPDLLPNQNITLAGTGTNRTISLVPLPNRFGTAGITLEVQDASFGLRSVSFTLTVRPVNDPPTISALADQTVLEDTPGPLLTFRIGDPEQRVESLQVAAQSSNPALIPDSNLVLDGSGAERTLQFTPDRDRYGTATIFVMVTDGIAITTNSFVVTVLPVNDAPSILNLRDQTTLEDVPTTPFAFQVSDLETRDLIVTAVSSNPGLLPDSGIVLTGSGSDRQMALIPAPDQNGTATVTVTVSDGTASVRGSFLFQVLPVNDPPTLSALPDLRLLAGAGPQRVPLEGLGTGSTNEDQALIVVASSSNPALIPHPTIQWTTPNKAANLLFTPQPGSSGEATITVQVDDGEQENNEVIRSFVVRILGGPILAPVAPRMTLEDSPPEPIDLLVVDQDDSVSNVTVQASSSNTAIIGDSGLVLTGTGSNRVLRLIPVPNAFGSAWINLVATDSLGLSNSLSFLLTVQAVDDPPTLDAIADLTATAGAFTTVVLTGISPGPTNELEHLSFVVTPDDPVAIPTPAITYNPPGTEATLTFTAYSSLGVEVGVKVTVFDDGLTSSGGLNQVTRRLVVHVQPRLESLPLRLAAQGEVGLLSWPATSPLDFALFSATDPAGPWTRLIITPVRSGEFYVMEVPLQGAARFYRLCAGCAD
ncbi:MAG TPA: Ig-like domain-containing protein [Verrucomicrobiae bacterium]|nr:Ig-like domain-containing protein [Verrucomicrobiae bacterium]